MEKQRLRRLGVPFLSWTESLDKRLYLCLCKSIIVLVCMIGQYKSMGLLWLISNFELETP